MFSCFDRNVANVNIDGKKRPKFPSQTFSETSSSLCENFLRFFVDKVTSARAQVSNMASPILDLDSSTTQWREFGLISLQTCKEIFTKLKFSPYNVLPSTMVKQALDVIGTDLVTIINNCLSTGVVFSVSDP